MDPKISIIIPCRKTTEAARCIWECMDSYYKNFEIIVLPDVHLQDGGVYESGKLQIIPTGTILPSHKRDLGIKASSGEIIAFIDADAYPPAMWLWEAYYLLSRNPSLGGVCGPGILPPGSPMRKKATDLILRVLPFSYRVVPKKDRYVDDYPTFNLIMWKKDIEAVGGFNCDYLTGEDTILCKRITTDLGKMILYSHNVWVFHDRREVFKPFFKQIGTYGRHRGYFFKKHPENSRKLIYLLPLICAIGIGAVCLLFLLYLVF